VNHACSTRDSPHKTLLNSSDRSEGSQRASRWGESLIAHVDGHRSVLNAYDTGREAETLLSSLNKSEGSQRAPRGGESLVARVNGYYSILDAYDAGKEAIWIHLSFRRRHARASPAT
jgi:hypothetical protein